MRVEVIALTGGIALVAIGIWFYLGNGWSALKKDLFLQYFFMAMPMGIAFVVMGIARSGIAGSASPLLAWAGVAFLLIAVILAYTKPAILAPRWLRKRGYTSAVTADVQTWRSSAEGERAVRFRWPIWVALAITVTVVVLATVIEWVKAQG